MYSTALHVHGEALSVFLLPSSVAMKPFSVLPFVLALLGFTTAQDQVTPLTTADLNILPQQPPSSACGEIVDQNLNAEYVWFQASLVRECLTSVPFNDAVATRFLTWFNQTLQFYTLPAFLKNPPAGYQQPPVDVFARLEQIEDRVGQGYYKNQYVFDADVQALIRDTHDDHLIMYAGALPTFNFGASFQLVTLSEDGKKEPEVYFWYTMKNYTTTQNRVAASPIKYINGIDVVEYIEKAAAQQVTGMLEPHADWNQMMKTPAQIINGYRSVFSSYSTFDPGYNELNCTYKNGSTYNGTYLAFYNSPGFTGPLETGGDFYNFFILNFAPASYDESYIAHYGSSNDDSQSTRRDDGMKDWNSVSQYAYPSNTIAHQADLGIASTGYVTGYYLPDISTAVVSIPSFAILDSLNIDSTGSFATAIKDFIREAKKRNAQKLIIDLQQNTGGQESLVFETVHQFFPSISPRTPSRMRSHPLGDYLGEAGTGLFEILTPDDELYDYAVSSEWVITDRIDYSTGQNFTSWQDFSGPLAYNGDTFSKVEEYNLSSQVFDADALAYTFNVSNSKTDPWDASNVVIFTDGICSSACSLFVEIATQQFGARTVVVGGNPKPGPMQAASGSRGALLYSSDDIDYDHQVADIINNGTDVVSPSYTNDTGMFIGLATINLRDQIRPADNTGGIPNQFLYLPADCRIYWTLANFLNYTRLWQDVSNAIYTDPTICVPGSRNASSTANTYGAKQRRNPADVVSPYDDTGLPPLEEIPKNPLHHGLFDSKPGSLPGSSQITYCSLDRDCQGKGYCKPTSITCTLQCNAAAGKPCQTQNKKTKVCAPFQTSQDKCIGSFRPDSSLNSKALSSFSKVYGASKDVQGEAPQVGYCIPSGASSGAQPACSAVGKKGS